jgi:hypothetical protein
LKSPEAVPLSSNERWDAVANELRDAKGKWVIVYDGMGRPARNDKVRANLRRRDLDVEIVSRLGTGNELRPWNGWRTWVRVKK